MWRRDFACKGVREGQRERRRANKALRCGAAKLLPVESARAMPSLPEAAWLAFTLRAAPASAPPKLALV